MDNSEDGRLNYSFYSGVDLYSDGEIEDEMLSLAKSNVDLETVIATDDRWPILYHFSNKRQNLLEWYPFKEGAEVLEIGAGCGAITGMLCDKCGYVTSVELSKKRSLINYHRNKGKRNFEIIVGNLNDITFDKQFDYITLVGVLEYAAMYTASESPYIDFLKNIKKNLKPGGTLIIAIENKFGLKYWAGSKEDHTGILFDGLENYPSNHKIQTFSKLELISIITEAGFEKNKFYYPFPDYKFSDSIYSDERLPKIGELQNVINNYDQSRAILFNEQAVYDNILFSAREYPFFSNSFLVFSK
ncbi:class I SAM-dependent methyltransferase [Paenibacillus sp. FSL R7-0337]|uniref:class I SAM-dependent methyltransferase n=1 Tax=Paenibacillus sp. FSL R7-0337 TaxID=1926588 RepID=UPI00096CB822|nr:class I SAM-dependent methyltransferase [Paenibacillus sp. FSL R7-0337]OMF88091.1 SAM-dependent methyltransferase [Paenibacillus sp. FSL R7-0337]